MKEVLEPLASIPGVRTAALVTNDGVPIAVQGDVGRREEDEELDVGYGQSLSTREERAPSPDRIDDSDRLNALAGLGTSWLGEIARTIAPLSWGAPEYMVLRAARGTLLIMQAPNSLLLVLLEGGMLAEDLRLPMEAAVARMQRVLRGVGKRDENQNLPGSSSASYGSEGSDEPSTTGIREVSGGM